MKWMHLNLSLDKFCQIMINLILQIQQYLDEIVT